MTKRTTKFKQNEPMSVYAMRLTARHAIWARRFADDNFGEGVRIAIEEKAERWEKEKGIENENEPK